MRRSGHIAIAGKPNVGKSSLLNALVGEHLALVSPKPQATRLPVVGLRTDGELQFVFHDLPGLLDPEYPLQERMRALALEGIARADIILYLHPAPEGPAPELASLSRLSDLARLPIMTIYTKADLVPASERGGLGSDALLVSTKTGEGLERLVTSLTAQLPEREFAFPPDEVGTQPVRFFVVEYLREAAFEFLEDELPYAFTAEVEEFRESGEPVYIRATLLVERESQKGILIGERGRTLKAIGQHARERMEQLLGRHVFLETWVKVLPRWRRDPELLRRFGFPDPPGERT